MYIDEIAEQHKENISQLVLDFFGSIEAAEKHGHRYTLEYEPIQMNWISGTDYSITQKVRIRLKTDEELEASQK